MLQPVPDKVVCLVVGAAKTWSVGLEIAKQLVGNTAEHFEVCIVDASAIQGLNFPSRTRKKYQKYICQRFGFREIQLNVFGVYGLLALALGTWVALRKNLKVLDRLETFERLRYLVESCICQQIGGREVDSSMAPRRLIFREARKSVLSFLYCKKLIKEPIQLVVYNGRAIIESLWIRRVIDLGGNVLISERGSKHSKYEIYKISPHFNPEWWQKIENAQKLLVEDSKASELINQYINNRLAGFDSFEDVRWRRASGESSDYLQLPREYLVYFATSSHEFSPIREFNSQPGFCSQKEAVFELLIAAAQLSIPVVIRRHPNSLSLYDSVDRERNFWQDLVSSNVIVIHPENKANSLEIAQGSRVTFVWKSSIGIETLSSGIPTYALGAARWAIYPELRAWNSDAIIEAIERPRLDFATRTVSAYAYYMATAGQEMTLFTECDAQKAIGFDGSVIFSAKTLDVKHRLKCFHTLYNRRTL
jgi:hypothetical protein